MSTKKPTRTTTVEVAAQTVQKRTRTADLGTAGLSDEEERVVRMARGLGVPANEPLALKYTETERARAALLAIEREMVLKMQQRTQTERARKSNIVDRLKSTARPKR